MNNKDKDIAFTVLLLACTAVGTSILSVVASSYFVNALGVGIILWANPICLPALAVLWINVADIYALGYLVGAGSAQGGIRAEIFYHLPLLSLGAMCVRVVVEWSSRDKRAIQSRWILGCYVLWLALLAVTVVASYWGRSLLNPNWTQPTRIALAMNGMFYGAILWKKIVGRLWILDWLFRILALSLILYSIGIYWNHIIFYYVTAAGVLFWYCTSERRLAMALICAIAPVTAFFNVGDTLTLYMLYAMGLFVGYFTKGKGTFGMSLVSKTWAIFLPILTVIPLVIVMLGYSPKFPTIGFEGADLLKTRVEDKLYRDRAILWKEAWESALESNSVIVAAGKPLNLNISELGSFVQWEVHAHNVFIEMMYQAGYLALFLFILLGGVVWYRMRLALMSEISPLLRAYGTAAFITIGIGGAVGIFPYDFYAGPWVWLWIGMALSQYDEILCARLEKTMIDKPLKEIRDAHLQPRRRQRNNA